jgi:hypothetical protein
MITDAPSSIILYTITTALSIPIRSDYSLSHNFPAFSHKKTDPSALVFILTFRCRFFI